MLEQLSFTGRELLVAVVLATAVYLLEVLVFSRRRRRDAASAQPAPEAVALRLETLERRLETLETRVAALAGQAPETPPSSSGHADPGADYGEAMRRAGAGATPEQLADELGLSRGEAELIIALRRADSVSGSTRTPPGP